MSNIYQSVLQATQLQGVRDTVMVLFITLVGTGELLGQQFGSRNIAGFPAIQRKRDRKRPPIAEIFPFMGNWSSRIQFCMVS